MIFNMSKIIVYRNNDFYNKLTKARNPFWVNVLNTYKTREFVSSYDFKQFTQNKV